VAGPVSYSLEESGVPVANGTINVIFNLAETAVDIGPGFTLTPDPLNVTTNDPVNFRNDPGNNAVELIVSGTPFGILPPGGSFSTSFFEAGPVSYSIEESGVPVANGTINVFFDPADENPIDIGPGFTLTPDPLNVTTNDPVNFRNDLGNNAVNLIISGTPFVTLPPGGQITAFFSEAGEYLLQMEQSMYSLILQKLQLTLD